MEYEDNRRNRSFVTTILLKLISLLLFLLVLIILFPTKRSLNPLYQSVFRDNLNSMKEAAESYYTVNRLPNKVGESTKMTLQEMLNKQLLIPFVDKNNKTCNVTTSYVEVTKTEDDYELVINLVCDEEEATIIDYLGCHDTCTATTCNKTEEPEETEKEEVIEYQFVKTTSQKKLIGYECSAGTLKGSVCEITKENESVLMGIPSYTDKVITTNATCETIKPTETTITKKYCNGVETTSDTCTTATTKNTAVTGTTYSSWVYKETTKSTTPLTTYTNTTKKMVSNGSGYERECDTCARVYYYYYIIYTRTASNTYTTTYTCPTGYTKVDNSTCSKASTTETITKKYCNGVETTSDICSTTCTCPTGYTKDTNDQTKCNKTTTIISGYTCPTGYKLTSDSKCSKTVTTTTTEKATPKYKTVTAQQYTWSRSKTLSGWTATGKTRTVTK